MAGFDAASSFDMSDAYRRASEIKPVKAKDLRAVYRPYDRTGTRLRVGGKQNASDKQLYNLATKQVIEWYRAKKVQPKSRKGTGGGTGAARTRNSGGTSSGTSGSAATRPVRVLPDTAMPAPGDSRVTTDFHLPAIPDDPVRTRYNRYTGKLVDPRLLEV